MAWSSPRTWLAGEDPSASIWNTHIRDQFKAIGDAWTAFTPTWTAATTNPVIGNGSITGFYNASGKKITFRINIVAGSTTTFGSGAYVLTYPVAAIVSTTPGICGWFVQGSTPNGVVGIGFSTTTFRMLTMSSNSFAGPTVPFTLANGNGINIGGTYEAA